MAAVTFDLWVPKGRSSRAKRAAMRPIVDGLLETETASLESERA